VAVLAPDVFHLRRLLLGNESAVIIQANYVAKDALRIELRANVLQRRVSPAVAGFLPFLVCGLVAFLAGLRADILQAVVKRIAGMLLKQIAGPDR
jgi:hypothetical protein